MMGGFGGTACMSSCSAGSNQLCQRTDAGTSNCPPGDRCTGFGTCVSAEGGGFPMFDGGFPMFDGNIPMRDAGFPMRDTGAGD
jgi:hypothetical protein